MKKGKKGSITNLKLPVMQGRALVSPDSLNEEDRSVELIFSTGERGLRQPFLDDPYYEELEISPDAIRTERLDKGLSVIDSHRVYEGIDGVFGITGEYTIANGELRGRACFSDDEESESKFRKVANGTLRHVSLGYIIHRMMYVGDAEDGLPILRAIDWTPTELSFVPVSFETTNGVRSAEQPLHKCELEIEDTQMWNKKHRMLNGNPESHGGNAPSGEPAAQTGVTSEGGEEPAPQQRAQASSPAPAPKIDLSAIRGELTAFTTAATQAGVSIEEATRAFSAGTDINAFRAQLLEGMATRANASAPGVPLVGERTDQADAKREDLASAMSARISGDYSKLGDAARGFAQMPMMECMRHYMMMSGAKNVLGDSSLNFAKRALHSTSDLPLILENVMNKELLAAYANELKTFESIARRTTVNDFREKNTYKLGDAPSLLPLGEHGEYQYGTFSESKESYRISTYARKLGFTRQMLINDDLSALQRFPQLFGGAAVRLENDIVWGLILNYDFITGKVANHRLSDNQPLFAEAHNNLLGAGSALDLDTLSNVRALGRNQKTLDGHILNVQYNTLAVGTDLETQAQKLLAGQYTPNNVNDINIFRNAMNLIIEPRISQVAGGATAQYYFSQQLQAIEYAYLAGNEGLYTETVESTDVDGTTILARHDFGAGFEDFRGAAKATGAA